MTVRPILFSGPLVRGILDGRKTVTRRLLAIRGRQVMNAGDKLWVRETWGTLDADHPRCRDGRKPQEGDQILYRANPGDDYQWGPGRPCQGDFVWRPSIHMPRWASRISLLITDVRVERLQDITPDDVRLEGVDVPDDGSERVSETTVLSSFERLWDQTYGARPGSSWDENPWVMRIAFERIRRA